MSEPDDDPTSLSQAIRAWRAALADTLSDGLRLLALEGRLAGLSLATMAGLALLAALLIASAWLALLATLLIGLNHWGLPWWIGLLLLAALNLLLGGLLIRRIIRLSRNLLFSASRRQFDYRVER